MPKRTRRSSGGTSVSRTLRAASRDAASSTTKDTQALEVAAGRFINTPELRQRVFKLLDHPSLARLARVQKAWTHDVAQLLYYEVGYAQVRSMSRANDASAGAAHRQARRAIYCDAVRRVTVWYHSPVSANVRRSLEDADRHPFQCAVRLLDTIVPALRKKCPKAIDVRFRQEDIGSDPAYLAARDSITATGDPFLEQQHQSVATTIALPNDTSLTRPTITASYRLYVGPHESTDSNPADPPTSPDSNALEAPEYIRFVHVMLYEPGGTSPDDIASIPGTIVTVAIPFPVSAARAETILAALLKRDNAAERLEAIDIAYITDTNEHTFARIIELLRPVRLRWLRLGMPTHPCETVRIDGIDHTLRLLCQAIPTLHTVSIPIVARLAMPEPAKPDDWGNQQPGGTRLRAFIGTYPRSADFQGPFSLDTIYRLATTVGPDCDVSFPLINRASRGAYKALDEAEDAIEAFRAYVVDLEVSRLLMWVFLLMSRSFARGRLDLKNPQIHALGIVDHKDIQYLAFDSSGRPIHVLHSRLDRVLATLQEDLQQQGSSSLTNAPALNEIVALLRGIRCFEPDIWSDAALRAHIKLRLALTDDDDDRPTQLQDLGFYLRKTCWRRMDLVMLDRLASGTD